MESQNAQGPDTMENRLYVKGDKLDRPRLTISGPIDIHYMGFRLIEAVKIGAPDYNPQAEKPFDGSPFSHVPQWLENAIVERQILIGNPGSTDYASFGFKDDYGHTVWYGPGDYILKMSGGNKIRPIKGDTLEAILMCLVPEFKVPTT